jgi:NADH-quinone oxidoreductase subunit L
MVVTAALTVAYSLRAWLMVFFGEARSPLAAAAHNPPAVMRVPLLLLAVPSMLGGLVVAAPGILGPDQGGSLFHLSTSVLMTLLVLVSGAVVVRLWLRRGADMWRRVNVPHPPVDVLYDRVVVRPVRRLATVVRAGDRDVIDAYAEGAAASTRGAGWLLRRAQNGGVQGYLMVVVVGATAIAVAAGVFG